MMGNMGIG